MEKIHSCDEEIYMTDLSKVCLQRVVDVMFYVVLSVLVPVGLTVGLIVSGMLVADVGFAMFEEFIAYLDNA